MPRIPREFQDGDYVRHKDDKLGLGQVISASYWTAWEQCGSPWLYEIYGRYIWCHWGEDLVLDFLGQVQDAIRKGEADHAT